MVVERFVVVDCLLAGPGWVDEAVDDGVEGVDAGGCEIWIREMKGAEELDR